MSGATFKAYAPPATPKAAANHSLYTITSDWDSTATWNNRKTGVAWTTAGGDISTNPAYRSSATSVAANPAWYSWTAPTAAVQGWVNGTLPNYGFMLKMDGAPGCCSYVFASTEASMSSQFPADSTQWPTLDVTWSQPAPADTTPPTISLDGDLVQLAGAWTKDDSGTVTVSATDGGKGVTKLELRNGSTVLGTLTQSCAAGGCAMSQSFAVDLAALGEGVRTLTATATDGQGNSASRDLTVRVDRGPPTLTLTGSLVDQQSTVASSGTREVHAAAADTGAGVTSIAFDVDGVEKHRATQTCALAGGCSLSDDWSLDLAGLSDGPHDIEVVASDASGRDKTQHLTVNVDRYPMPAASTLSESEVTPFIDQVSFLWSGSGAIQTGVAAGTIEARRASVITGKVLNDLGEPAGGVKVSVVDHPEFGSTLSRGNGEYFLAVNGGQDYRVRFELQGALPADRQVTTEWEQYSVVDDVRLVGLSNSSSPVTFGSSATTLQVATGATVSDQDGTRRVRVLVRPGTVATVQHADGSLTPLTGGDMRFTEYTIGPDGSERMPAPLPSASAYTWATDYRIDQASGPDVRHVRFSKPVVSYVDDFLDQPVGVAVPVGTYEPELGRWVGEPDGRIIKIVGVDGSGKAIVDVTGFGAANAGELANLNVSDDELRFLADTYPVGKKLSRVQMTHFSTSDHNYGYWRKKHKKLAMKPKKKDGAKGCDTGGSIIGCQNQSLGEVAGLGGTPYALRYSSNRTPGALGSRAIDVPLTNDSLDGAFAVQADVVIAGQRMTFRDNSPTPNETHTFVWDGKDAFGRPMVGGAVADVTVHNVYPATSYSDMRMGFLPADDDEWEWVSSGEMSTQSRSFALEGFGNNSVSRSPYGAKPPVPPVDRPALQCDSTDTFCWYPEVGRTESALMAGTREDDDYAQRFQVKVPYADQRSFGVGGWGISDLHRYDAATGTLFSGDGQQRASDELSLTVRTMRLGLSSGMSDTTSSGLAVLPDGSTLRGDVGHHRVVRDWPDGHTTVFAGSSSRNGTAGDGGLAIDATFQDPNEVAVGPDGSVYIADVTANYVRKVTPDGIVRTIAGSASSADDGAAGSGPLQRRLYTPRALAIASDGTLYIGDHGGLVRVDAAGGIARIGNVAYQQCPATPSGECLFLTSPVQHVAVAGDGTVYWSGNDGTPITRIYSWVPGDDEAKVLAVSDNRLTTAEGVIENANLVPRALAVDDGGRLWIAAQDYKIYRLEANGRVTHIGLDGCQDSTGDGLDSSLPYKGEGGPFVKACGDPVALAHGPDAMYLDDTSGSVRRITVAIPDNPAGSSTVPSDDGGEAYVFDSAGRQIATRDGVTGRTTRTFAYDAQGRISGITETDFGTTTFTYDSSGNATVTGPDGQLTHVDVNADGYATKITDASGAHQDFAYRADGLMTSRTNELGDTTTFGWSPTGRLISDTTPLSEQQTLSRSDGVPTTAVEHRDASGAQTTYAIDDDGNNTPKTTVTMPDGTQLVTTQKQESGSVSQEAPDGSSSSGQQTGDARWGASVPHGTTTVTLPSGKTLTSVDESKATRTESQDQHNPFDFQTLTNTFTLKTAGQNRVWTSTYTKTTRKATTTTPMGRTASTTFDTHDRPVTLSTPGRDDVTITYDTRGRATAVSQGTASSSVTYGADGRVATDTDAEGGVTSYAYDSVGQPTAVTAPDNTTTHMAWDAAGQLRSLTAPDNRLFSFTYDKDGRMTAGTQGARAGSGDPTLTTHTGYDPAGRLTDVTRASGKTLALHYDAAGRPTSATADDGTSVEQHYEAVTAGKGGRLSSVETDQGASTSFEYDGPLVTKISQTADTQAGDATGAAPDVSVSYDGALRPSAQTIAGDSTPVTYNDDDQPTQIGPLAFAYDATTGDPTGLTAGATATSMTLDGNGDLESLANTADAGSGAAPVLSEFVTRDKLGRIVSRSVADDTGTHLFGYTYDPAGRLTQVTKDSGVVESYGYDSTGALTSRGAGLLMGSFTLDGYGRPTQAPDGSTVAWSTDGEQTSVTPPGGGAGTSFSYDGFGRLSRVTLPDGRVGSYRYDALGRRTAVRLDGSLVRRYVYGGSLWPQARVDAAGSVLERYVYGSQAHVPDLIVRRDGQRIRLVTDSVGSVRVAVDADTGQVLERVDYDAYGRTTRDTNPGLQPFGFKGALADPVAQGAGLVWMGVRAYQPALARFTTAEPAGLAAVWNDPDALAGDPINLIDADGALPVAVHRFITSVANGMGDTTQVAVDVYWMTHPTPLGAVTDQGFGGAAGMPTLNNVGDQLNNWGGHPEWNPCPGIANEIGEGIGAGLVTAGVGAETSGARTGGSVFGWTLRGGEIRSPLGNVRVSPVGHEARKRVTKWGTDNPVHRRLPHYHRRGPGGIGRHRPWEKKPGDSSWTNRF